MIVYYVYYDRKTFIVQGPYSQHFTFVVTYEWLNKIECNITLDLRLASGQTI
jgi:hypothetical protein